MSNFNEFSQNSADSMPAQSWEAWHGIEDDPVSIDDYEITPTDLQRMRTVTAGDEVSLYLGFPDVQRQIIAQERATRRATSH